MPINDKKNDDFNLDFLSDEDPNFENLFDEKDKTFSGLGEKQTSQGKSLLEDFDTPLETSKKKKRTISDFEPDMDALLMTAQSSMIIEGMQKYNKKIFSSETLNVYIEALKGVDFYIKMLNRNPNNYRKLKTLIDSDPDCQQVENFAFVLFKEKYSTSPESDKEKLEAFELFKQIFKQSVNKATVSKSMKILRKYFLISGGLDFEKIQEYNNEGNIELKRDVYHFHQHIKLALEMIKIGDSEITQGLKGRDLNVYITKTSELLGYYYKLVDNIKISDYYYRIYNIYKKYFIVK